jgi:Fe2+ transport system protein FeoA
MQRPEEEIRLAEAALGASCAEQLRQTALSLRRTLAQLN